MVHRLGWDEVERVTYHALITFIHPSLRQSLNYQLLYPTNLYSNRHTHTYIFIYSLHFAQNSL